MRIPTPVQRGQPVGGVTVNPLQPVFQNTQFANNQETAQNLSSLGQTLGTTASILAQRRQDIDMRTAQSQIDAAVREINDPNGGIMSRRGANARGASDEIDSIMARVRGEINIDQLAGSSRQAVDTLLTKTGENLYNRVAQFEMGQLEAYDTELTQARVASAADMAAADPLNNETYQTGILQAMDAGELLAGKVDGAVEGDDLWKQTVTEQTSTVVLSRVDALAATSANGAGEFLDAAYEAGHIDATSYNAAVATLEPRKIEEDARIISEEARRIGQGGSLTDPASPIMRLITTKESGSGGYDALYGQGQNSDFSGVKISTMSISELVEFSNPSGEYGQWVKPRLDPDGYAAQNGLTSTPMGKYQIVGGTLRSLIEEMGLTGDEVFDEAMQDQMFGVLMQRRLSASSSAAGKREGMRNEWEGFRDVSDRELDAAIAAFESGGGASYATPEDRINAEQDPERRALARQFYNADASAQRAADARAREATVDGFFATVDSMTAEELQNTTWDQFLSQAERDLLGTDVTGLRSWWATKRGGDPVTPPDVDLINDIRNMVIGAVPPVDGVSSQTTFMERNLQLDRAAIGEAAYVELLATQGDMKARALNPDLPSIEQLTPTRSRALPYVQAQMKELGLEGEQAYESQLLYNVMTAMQAKGSQQGAGFTAWTDPEIMDEVALQSVKVTVDDGSGGLSNQTSVPLFQLATDLGDQDATANDLIAAATVGTVQVGDYFLTGTSLADAKDLYLAENPDFEDVYAEDLIEFVYSKLRLNPDVLRGVTTLADRAQEAALSGGMGLAQEARDTYAKAQADYDEAARVVREAQEAEEDLANSRAPTRAGNRAGVTP